MPKKHFVREPAVTFQGLYDEWLAIDPEFVINTPDSAPELFADKLIDEHYPPQSELPLT